METAQQLVTLDSLSTKEIVELYNRCANALGEKPVTRFSDRETAIKRTRTMIERYEMLKASKQPAYMPNAKKPEDLLRKDGSPRSKRSPRFILPLGPVQKPPRPETMRAKLLALLERENGATFEEAIAGTWGEKRDMSPQKQRQTTYEAIRLLHYFNGYGLKQDADGRIRAVSRQQRTPGA